MIIRNFFPILFLLSQSAVFAEETVTFNRDVRPILSDKCFFCHGPDHNKREADLRLDVRETAIELGAIVPDDASSSEMLARVLSEDPDVHMPPPSSKIDSLTPTEIEILRKWIDQGAQYESHWAFIPVPPIASNATSAEIIDRPIQEALKKRGLTQQPSANRNTLIRRLNFDITGLPPTAQEVDSFVNDASLDAYEKVVDRLLASEQYGERMAVDWLDAARYADSYGFQVDRERDVWTWRDWVVRAFNSNMPYDQFVTWQLAGDLLPNATQEQVMATLYNRLHQQESEGGSVEEEYRVEYVCDRVQTFATNFLGLTFECSRCHDHKFDPITQRDYYGLFAMFQNIDEAGLYSYFTTSPPTPTVWLTDEATESKLKELREKVQMIESQSAELRSIRRSAFDEWLAQAQLDPNVLLRSDSRQELASFDLEKLDGDKLANAIRPDQPALLRGENKLVPGRSGNAIEFTGDDSVDLPIGNFNRQQPFSVSLWIKTPTEFDRAVVFRRSVAWTDAASRGYELLIIDGRLQWSLVHFWPGNAISVASENKIPLGEWTQVTVTSDGSSLASGLKIFVNGQLSPTLIVKDNLTKEITGGGGDNIGLGERFRDRGFKGGQIDDFRVYQRAITPLEVLATFNPATAQQILVKPTAEWTDSERALVLDAYLSLVDRDWASHLAELQNARDEHNKVADSVREMMAMRELPEPKKAYILFRGEYNQRRDEVTANTPAVLPQLPESSPRNRLGLAQWLMDPKHPLTSRVTVNRIWQSIFGRGLVRTSEDFGNQGARPLYPEVLDGIAGKLMASGWDVKALVKTIVMSETYRQQSVGDERIMADDPDNEWLARGSRYRLPAEMIRDNALAAAGLLDRRMGGPPVNPYEMSEAFKPVGASGGTDVFRRSLYTQWRRTSPPPAMLAFDAPRRAVCIAKRERTDSPLQALILLNGIQYVEAARVLGESLHKESNGDIEKMIQAGFLRCLSRQADSTELDILRQLYSEQRDYFSKNPEQAKLLTAIGTHPRDAAVSDIDAASAAALAQALLNHDECVVKR